ncbi:MAG TPA: CoA transferase [Dehalococcoidia bacterium]|nr:CoA transferase [Dehalococcoidia bacterium]
MTNRPLEGIRIADFGWVLAVPHATAWLGTLGAEVIRVESMARLDIARAGGLARGADGEPGMNRGGMFNGLNFGKKGITLNLAHPKGLDLAKELIRRSDVVTENFGSGVFEKLGLGYDVVRELKPDIIMLSGSPLGSKGPDGAATGWGPNTQAYAGLPHITGYEGGPPSGLGGFYPDYMIGVVMAFALLTALHHRRLTGEGQFVELAMAETVAAMIPEAILDYTMNGRERERIGNYHESMAPHGVYRTKGDDTWVAIAVRGDDDWAAMRRAMGEPAWAADPRFDDALGRRRHREELDRCIAEWTRQRTDYEAMHALQAAGVPAAPCSSAASLLEDPQVLERGTLPEIDHPETGPRRVVGLPGRLGALTWDYRRAPCFGEHNDDVYGGLLGLSRDEIDRLVAEQVIF